ncbi:MAG: hypothetical protein ACSLFQ_09600 [Thermoanaerobaculia bacterium]
MLLITIGALELPAEERITEGRKHFTISRADGVLLGLATVIHRSAPTWFRSVVLFRASTGDELVLENSTDYNSKTMEWTIRNVKGDAWITARVTLPFSGTTEAEALAEFQNTETRIFKLMRPDLEFETNAGSWKGSETEWAGDARLEITKQLRIATSFDLLETIERSVDSAFVNMQVVGIDVDDEMTYEEPLILQYLLYRPRCGRNASKAEFAVPDCDFDERFGFPCSEKQLSRAKTAEEAGEAPERY